MTAYIPHTPLDTERMLSAIGLSSMQELFSTIPSDLILDADLPLERGIGEERALQYIRALANKNILGTSFLGMGSYDRIIPSAVKELGANPAFVTAYTPYQSEISQGLLQAIFEFQSMMCLLTGLDAANASLYDHSSAAAEAASVMLQAKRKSSVILVSQTLHPFTLEVLKTWAKGTANTITIIPECRRQTDVSALVKHIDETVAGVIVQTPNRYGFIEDYGDLATQLHQHNALLCISSDPLSLVLQQSPKQRGADIAIGDTQPLGLPSGFGGPSCGYMAVTEQLIRRLPGRIVGQTVDANNNKGYVLTLQAREQHIKRQRSASNICSNQALAALMTTIHISLVGQRGLEEAAQLSWDKAHYLADKLAKIDSLLVDQSNHYWCEFPLTFKTIEQMERVLAKLKEEHIWGGVRLGPLTKRPNDASTIIVAVTEKRTKEELDRYVQIVSKECL
ncbi:MAG: aminomethyl-transferring glycine dehydrogenase subunit GcvPA [Sphaerochaetaceae bacterium]